jgi:tetratricopeptide (TPR) repeat protein
MPERRSMGLRIQLLGSFGVWRGKKPVMWVKGEKPKLLLKILLTEPGRVFPHDELIEKLWPNRNSEAAATLLNRVAELRRILQPGLKSGSNSRYILTHHLGFSFNPESCFIDAHEFQRHYHQAKQLEAQGDFPEAVQEYESAMGLYKGDYLEEDRYEEWLQPVREHFSEMYLECLSCLTDRYVQMGEYSKAIGCCRRLLEKDRYREKAYRQLMLCHCHEAEPGESLRAYQMCREAMAGLRAKPSIETEQLRQKIMKGEIRPKVRLPDAAGLLASQAAELKRAAESLLNVLETDVKQYQNEDGLRIAGNSLDLLRELERRGAERPYILDRRFRLLSLKETICHTLGRREEQAQAIDGLEELARQLGDRRKLASAFTRRGILHRATGEYPEAAEAVRKALSICRETRDRNGEGAGLMILGSISSLQGQYEDALRHYRRALKIYEATGDMQNQGRSLGNIANTCSNTGRYEEALDCFRKALGIAEELGDRIGQGTSLSGMGIACHNMGLYEEAMGHFRQALDVRRKAGDKRGQGFSLGGMGDAFCGMGRFREALRCHREALEMCREAGNRWGEAYCLGGMGYARLGMGKAAGALEHFGKALALCEELGAKAEQMIYLSMAAVSCLRLRRKRQALELSGRAVKMAGEGQTYVTMQDAYFNHCRVLRAHGRETEALEYLKKARAEVVGQSGRIKDPLVRHRFLRDVKANREIMEEWGKHRQAGALGPETGS